MAEIQQAAETFSISVLFRSALLWGCTLLFSLEIGLWSCHAIIKQLATHIHPYLIEKSKKVYKLL